MARRIRRTATPPAFCQTLREAGWLLKTAPMAILAGLGLDEYVYVERTDRLKYIHIHSHDKTEWEAKRYTREPFGDYTTCYQPLGKGSGLESLRAFLETK